MAICLRSVDGKVAMWIFSFLLGLFPYPIGLYLILVMFGFGMAYTDSIQVSDI